MYALLFPRMLKYEFSVCQFNVSALQDSMSMKTESSSAVLPPGPSWPRTCTKSLSLFSVFLACSSSLSTLSKEASLHLQSLGSWTLIYRRSGKYGFSAIMATCQISYISTVAKWGCTDLFPSSRARCSKYRIASVVSSYISQCRCCLPQAVILTDVDRGWLLKWE